MMPTAGKIGGHGLGKLEQEDLARLRNSAVFFEDVELAVVSVVGADAAGFLQGMLSQDVQSISVGRWAWSFFLQPNGKVHSLLQVGRLSGGTFSSLVATAEGANANPEGGLTATAHPDAWLLVAEGRSSEELADALGRYLVRVKAEVRAEPWLVATRVSGAKALSCLEAVVGACPGPYEIACSDRGFDPSGSAAVVIRAPYPSRLGFPANTSEAPDVSAFDVLTSARTASLLVRALSECGASVGSSAAMEAARLLAGFPKGGRELDEKTIVQETGWQGVAVSFTKGCYLGQELVARIDSRGHVNRYLSRIVVESAVAESDFVDFSGSDAFPLEISVDGRGVGTATSGAVVAGRLAVFLGYLRREVPPGAQVEIQANGRKLVGRAERVEPIP